MLNIINTYTIINSTSLEEDYCMDFQIVSGIPLPKGTGRPRKYDINIEAMDVGDMVMIPIDKSKVDSEVIIIRNFVRRYAKKNSGTKFTTRKIEGGVGVWRIS